MVDVRTCGELLYRTDTVLSGLDVSEPSSPCVLAGSLDPGSVGSD